MKIEKDDKRPFAGTADQGSTYYDVQQVSPSDANAVLSASAGNHRWEDNVCIHCGCKRTKKTFKYLMAITNYPPYDHYMYEQGYVYETGEQTTRERPFCPGRSSSR